MKRFAAAGCLILIACDLRAFQFPLTRSQRAQKLVERGQDRLLRGNYFEAIDSCTQAIAVREDWAPAYLCRGEARLRMHDQDALKDAFKALRLDSRSGEPYRILGILDYEMGRHQSAIRHFGSALDRSKLRPDLLPDVYYYRARSRLASGGPAAAQEALQDVEHGLGILQGINGDYNDWSFYSLRGEIYRRLKQTDKAASEERRVIDLINRRLRRRPHEAPELLLRRAESNTLLGSHEEAARDYGEILRLSPGSSSVLLDRAHALSSAGKPKEAIQDLDRILRKEPLHAQALRLRALERLKLQDRRGALADLDIYVTLQPSDHRSRLERARVLVELAQDMADDNSEAPQRLSLLREAALECEALLQEDSGNEEVSSLHAAIEALIDPAWRGPIHMENAAP